MEEIAIAVEDSSGPSSQEKAHKSVGVASPPATTNYVAGESEGNGNIHIHIHGNDTTAAAATTATTTNNNNNNNNNNNKMKTPIPNKHGGRNRGRRTGARPPPESQAKRRMEAMASGVDHKLVTAFIFILVLYTVITIGTWMSLESQDYRHEVIEQIKIDTNGNINGNGNTNKYKRAKKILEAIHNSLPITKSAGGIKQQIAKQRQRQQQQQQQQQHSPQIPQIPPVRAEDISDIETLQHTFPVHASGDLETIDHPGIFLSDPKKIKRILLTHKDQLPQDGKMQVPKFWRPTAYGPGGVREFLGNYGETLLTPEQAATIGSFHPESGLPTFYVSVASYRDPECQPTVEDMFLRAEHPERLRVAVVEQRVQGEDDEFIPFCGKPLRPCSEDPDQTMCKYSNQIDVFVVPAILSIGPVFARHIANRMYRGEYFAMQVDSHVRFIHHWDSDLISQWESAKNEMAIITTYLSDITDSIDPVTFENKHPNRPIMCKTDYEGKGKLKHLRHGQQPEGIPGIHGEPTLHPFWAAGFSFARGHFVVQVPYDQYEPMVFQGEEIFIGLRGWSYGYDYYTAETSVAFHMYAIKKNKDKRKNIKLFWENSNLYPGSAVQGMKRLNGIIGTGDPGDKFYNASAKEYGLGNVRPKEQFYKLYGIHTETKKVEDNLCSFVGKPMQEKFKPYLRKNRMGIDFSKVTFEWKDPNSKQNKKDK